MSLINTRMQNMRSQSNMDKYEIRPSRYGALDLYMNQTSAPNGIITDELKKKADVSIGNTLEFPVIDYDAGVTIGSARTVTISDDENTSQMVAVTFATYAWGFTMVPAMYSNNEVSMQTDFNKKFEKYLYKLADTLDSVAATSLNTNKTQVFNDTLLYDELADTLVVPYSQREEIIGDIDPMMAANDYFSQLHLVGNGGLESIVRKLAEKGLYNSENKQLQYADKVMHFTRRILNGAGKYATAYAVNQGSLGMLWRFERESLLNTKSRTGHEWGIDTLPLLNLPVGTYYYESVGDYSAIGGAATADLTRARKEHYGFAVDIAFMVSYNSDIATLANPIIKFNINTAATDADTTAPTVTTVTSAAVTAVTLTFSEVMCTDQAGTIITGDVSALFGFTQAGGAAGVITSATASSDGKSVVFVIVQNGLAAADSLDSAAALYDGAGNLLASGTVLADINAGATAWEAAP